MKKEVPGRIELDPDRDGQRRQQTERLVWHTLVDLGNHGSGNRERGRRVWRQNQVGWVWHNVTWSGFRRGWRLRDLEFGKSSGWQDEWSNFREDSQRNRFALKVSRLQTKLGVALERRIVSVERIRQRPRWRDRERAVCKDRPSWR